MSERLPISPLKRLQRRQQLAREARQPLTAHAPKAKPAAKKPAKKSGGKKRSKKAAKESSP